MTSPRSGSEVAPGGRGAFDLLADPVRRWVGDQGWTRLRDVQERAIPAVLAGGDVVVSARTAAGKTEAAFLPLMSRLATGGSASGFAVLYVSPLKALINDQAGRLEALAEACGQPLHRWHGDVSADAKRRARERPAGVVLITPESLEAILLRQGGRAGPLFAGLTAVVVDELHAFIGSERGVHLQSLLTRIEAVGGRDRIDRIGLSATLGDMRLAAEALRPGGGDAVRLVEGRDEGNGIRMQVRGYVRPTRDRAGGGAANVDAPAGPGGRQGVPEGANPAIVAHLLKVLRTKSNLLFAGSRRNVELFADALRAACEGAGSPNEFFPHHGNLSRAEREEVERRLRDDPRPTTAVATTTLELGIDIGDVETIAQIGPGTSVSALRQRLGRSGRRPGKPAQLRIYVEEGEGPFRHPVQGLHLDLVQAIAIVRCMLENWCEPPAAAGLHLSTLVHQTLALVVQTGGARPTSAWDLLCRRGPFRTVDRDLYVELLRCMASGPKPLVEQSPDGLLMLGPGGERLTAGHEFYAVFATPEEYRVVHGERTLGTLPLEQMILPGQTIIFAGRRWLVLSVDADARVVLVKPSNAALPPLFGGDGGALHDRVADTMREVLASDDVPVYLDEVARGLLLAARAQFERLGLRDGSILQVGKGVILLPWVGTRRLETFGAALLTRRFKASAGRHCVEVDECDVATIGRVLGTMATGGPPDGASLAAVVPKPALAKYDEHLSEALLRKVVEVERLHIESVPATAARLLIRDFAS